MKRLVCATLAVSLLGATAASAQSYGHGGTNRGYSHSRGHDNTGALVGLGIGLFALGAIIAASSHNNGFGPGDRRERYLGPREIARTAEEKERRTVEVAAVTSELGAAIAATSENGDTALHVAASQALNSVVQLLVDKGADLEAANKRGLTPLGLALLPRAADPLQISGVDRRKGTADLLRKLGAKEPDPAVLKKAATPDPRGFQRLEGPRPPAEGPRPPAPGPAPPDAPEKRPPQ